MNQTPNNENPPPRRARLKRLMLVWGTIFLLCYVFTYVALSRASVRELSPFKMPGFWYLPASMLKEENRNAWGVQFALYYFFAPANWIDRTFFNGPWPAGEPLWGIGPRRGKGSGER
jgi:hypothetical protein